MRHKPQIIVLEEAGSTNEELMKLARNGAEHGSALIARTQTAGRGRRDHSWTSPKGGLYFSMLFRPQVPSRLLPGLPVVCGLAVARALQSSGIQNISLKWPNDIITSKGKLGGILVEAAGDTAGMLVVCGIGINFHAPARIASEASALPATGIVENLSIGCTVPTTDELAHIVHESLLDQFESWSTSVIAKKDDAAPLTGVLDTYNRFLAYKGEGVRAIALNSDAEVARGTLTGVDIWGRALIQSEPGSMEAIDCSQASIRPLTSPDWH